MTRKLANQQTGKADYSNKIDELQIEILGLEPSMDYIRKYNSFRDLGGIPTDAMRQKLRASTEKLKSEQNIPHVETSTTSSVPSSPSASVRSESTRSPAATGEQPPAASVASSTITAGGNAQVATAAISMFGTVLASYFSMKSAQHEREASQAQTMAILSEMRAERQADREHDQAAETAERNWGLFMLGLDVVASGVAAFNGTAAQEDGLN